MANEKFYVTQEGYNDLVNEHENLVHKVRQEVIVELQEARAQGDLSENADYDAAREHQAQVEGRIRELESNRPKQPCCVKSKSCKRRRSTNTSWRRSRTNSKRIPCSASLT